MTPAERFLQPPGVFVPLRSAAALMQRTALGDIRNQFRDTDPTTHDVLAALRQASEIFAHQIAGTRSAETPEPDAPSTLTPAQAGRRIGMSDSGIRKACREDRLPSTLDERGHHQITPDALAEFDRKRHQ